MCEGCSGWSVGMCEGCSGGRDVERCVKRWRSDV